VKCPLDLQHYPGGPPTEPQKSATFRARHGRRT
jgi:hypothetical protein